MSATKQPLNVPHANQQLLQMNLKFQLIYIIYLARAERAETNTAATARIIADRTTSRADEGGADFFIFAALS
jgi:hypothetical protein